MPTVPYQRINAPAPTQTPIPNAVANIGKALQVVAERLQQQQENRYILEASNDYANKLSGFLIEEKKKLGKAADGARDRGAEYSEQSAESWLDNAPNENVRLEIERRFFNRQGPFLNELSRHQAIQSRVHYNNLLKQSLSDTKRDAYQNALEIEPLVQSFNENVNHAETSNVIGKLAADILRTQGKKEIVRSGILGLIDNNNLMIARRLLKNPEYKKILGADIDTLNDEITEKEKAIIKENETLKKELKKKKDDLEKDLHDKEETSISKTLLEGKYTEAQKLLTKNRFLTADEINKWRKEINSALAKDGDPYKESDEAFTQQYWKESALGMHKPEEIFPISGKMSRTDANIAQEAARMFYDPLRKHIVQQMASVIREGREWIMGRGFLIGYDPQQPEVKQANDLERKIRQRVFDAETDEEKIELLDSNSNKFLLNYYLGPEYKGRDKSKGRSLNQPDYSSMFYDKPQVETGTGENKVMESAKMLWGEK